MDNDKTMRGLRQAARDTEIRLTGSLLKWKYKKEGKELPDDQMVEHQSRIVTDQVHQILSRRGKSIWRELKEACLKKSTKEDPPG